MEAVRTPEPGSQSELILLPGHQGMVTYAVESMQSVTSSFKEAVSDHPHAELHPSERDPDVTLTPGIALRGAELPEEWTPHVVEYSSEDPFQKANPGLTLATKGLVRATILVAQEVSIANNPELTYVDANRASRGKNATLITKALANIDLATGQWINNLPDAEQLRPVANPYFDGGAITLSSDGTFNTAEVTKPFLAVVGGANDGRAVREREAVEKTIIAQALSKKSKNTLQLTSFGTGTGEPAMDTAIEAMRRNTRSFDVHVNGIDINPRSLAVANHLASKKSHGLNEGESLHFTGSSENILSIQGIRDAIAKTNPDVIEAVGLAEYIPSENADSLMEQAQRKEMQTKGCISAEEFYRTIWESMPEGSTFVTGNMRDDSREASFVIDGLGWKGIIQRSTKEYLTILKNADIPAEAVTLYTPKPGEESSGVYNIVCIQKPVS